MTALSLVMSLALATANAAPPIVANALIIESGDTNDWVRLLVGEPWKEQDTILRPVSLIKMKLNDIPAGASVTSATLFIYIEQSQPGGAVSVNAVTDDSWSYLLNTSDQLFNWPVDHTIASYATGQTGWRKFDVTAEVQQNLAAADRVLSIKIGDAASDYRERIASPAAHDFGFRPYLKVDLLSPVSTPSPDLTLGSSDIRLSDATPGVNQLVQVTATVRNVGSDPAQNVQVRLYDGDPQNGGVAVGGVQTIASIAPTGGTGTASFTWLAAPGSHALTIVVDPAKAIAELDESNNVVALDVSVQQSYVSYFEGFETRQVSDAGTGVWEGLQSGFGGWTADADVPFDANIDLSRQWRIVGTRTEAYEGHGALQLYLDGRSDDGTIWVERSFPVDPNTTVNVDLSFAFGKTLDAATHPVYSIGFSDPEVEEDFTWLTLGNGWQVHHVLRSLATGSNTRLWVAVGLTVTWEIEVVHYLDRIAVSVQ